MNHATSPRGRTPARADRRPPASRRPDRETARAVVASPEFRRAHRLPGTARVTVEIDGDRYNLRPREVPPDGGATAAFRLTPVGPDAATRAAVEVAELADPGEGCSDPIAAGLVCDCRHYAPEVACRHLRALAAARILRPATLETWAVADAGDDERGDER